MRRINRADSARGAVVLDRLHQARHNRDTWRGPVSHVVIKAGFGGFPVKDFFLQFFTWWNGQTIGTRFFTARQGERVGQDEFGNTYYRSRGRKPDPALGHERRWVVYKGAIEASSVPAGWNGWLHHTVDVAPSEETYVAREWQARHVPNMTGTAQAYRPPGSAVGAGAHPKSAGAYDAWTPGR